MEQRDIIAGTLIHDGTMRQRRVPEEMKESMEEELRRMLLRI